MFMMISKRAFKSFSLLCKSYLSIIVYNFWNVSSHSVLAIHNQFDTFAEKYLIIIGTLSCYFQFRIELVAKSKDI